MNRSSDIIDAIDKIIAGKNVERNVHSLVFDGEDLTDLFLKRAEFAGFIKTTVGGVNLDYDERVAAFAVRNSTAYFGWVFIERFNASKSRKLFGSDILNRRGDWVIQIPWNSREYIYVHPAERIGRESGSDFVLE